MIYKLLRPGEWAEFRREEIFRGSELDRADGFIHFSGAAQVHSTAEKYFSDDKTTVLLEVDPSRLSAALVWETSSRGVFPHLYGEVPLRAVVRTWTLTRGVGGLQNFPADFNPS